MIDPFAVAAEHVAWIIRQGISPADLFAAMKLPPPGREPPTWNDAIWPCARMQEDMLERQPRLADPVVYSPVYAQFRLPLKRVA